MSTDRGCVLAPIDAILQRDEDRVEVSPRSRAAVHIKPIGECPRPCASDINDNAANTNGHFGARRMVDARGGPRRYRRVKVGPGASAAAVSPTLRQGRSCRVGVNVYAVHTAACGAS